MTTFVLKKLPKARAREESRAGARAAALTACSDDAPAPTGHASGLGRALQKKPTACALVAASAFSR